MKIYSKNNQVDKSDLTKLLEFMTNCKGDYVVEVKKLRDNRTNNQNRLMWDIYKQVSDQTGYETDEVHAMCGQKFLLDESKKVPFVKSTAKLNTLEFSKYIDRIVRFFSVDCGFTVYLPEDYKRSENNLK